MKISIIIPVYNVAPFLMRCLDSCLRQRAIDFEVVVVDDGSVDGSDVILDEYARTDSRVKVIHKRNEGVVVARKTGVKVACGDWVLFLDGDDWLLEGALDELASGAADDVDIVTADHMLCIDGRENVRRIGFTAKRLSGPNYVNECMRYHHGYIWGKLYRRSLIEKIDVDVRYTQNEDYLIHLIAGAKARNVAYVQKPVYCYYWSTAANRSQKYSFERGLFSIVNVHKDVVRFIEGRHEVRFVLNDGYLTYLLHNINTGISSPTLYPGFAYFKNEMRRAFLRTPGRLLACVVKRIDAWPAYLCFAISVRLGRIVYRLYAPVFNVAMRCWHKMRGSSR